jgi:hypothetical protein
MKIIISIFIGLLVLAGLLIGYLEYFVSNFSPGTHGSLQSYHFNVSKYKLEETILKEIESNPKIQRDTSSEDTYYNTDGYITLSISDSVSVNKYVFRFYGDEEYWNANPTISEIFICYLHDANGMAISEGNDNVESNKELVNRSIELFQNEIVTPVNKVLNQ